MREQTMAAVGRLTADPGKNGGVSIRGWLDNQVLVRAKIQTWADSDSEAAALASQVRVDSNTGQVSASGPDSQGRSGWAVSYEIFAPKTFDLKATTTNGGISLTDLSGRIEVETKNGGLDLARVTGDVTGETTNGGVKIVLAGTGWVGRQMDVKTTNGGVSIRRR